MDLVLDHVEHLALGQLEVLRRHGLGRHLESNGRDNLVPEQTPASVDMSAAGGSEERFRPANGGHPQEAGEVGRPGVEAW